MYETLINGEAVESERLELYLETPDKANLFVRCWQTNDEPKAVIILAHGMGEHIDRYDHWAAKFTEAGYHFISMDMRGHGKSVGKRGYASSFRQIIDDYDLLVQKTKELFPDVPKILYGHSLGGNVVANYSITRQKGITGIILTSPWFSLAFKPSRMKYIAGMMMKHFLPGLTLNSGLEAGDMSRDQEEVKKYASDPSIHEKISLKLFFDIEEAGERASKSIYKINAPILVMHGSGDRVTSFETTKEFVMNAGNKTTFREWMRLFHELHNDTGADKVFQYISDWLDKTLKNIK